MIKRLCLLLLGAMLSFNAVAAGKFWDRPARVWHVDESVKIKLAENGKALCEVVVDKAATPAAKAAAEDLASSLSRVIGSTVAVVNTPTGGKVALIVGDGALTRSLGVDVSKLVRDGFIIRTFPNNQVVIAGRDDPKCVPGSRRVPFGDQWERATMFGVTTFLKKFAGVEFFYPGKTGTVYIKNANLSLPKLDIFDRPDGLVRYVYSYGSKLDGKSLDGYAGRLINHKRRFQTALVPCVHGLARMRYAERFGQSHPEYFAMTADGRRMTDGARAQLCWSSGIVEEIYQDARAWLSGSSPHYIRGTKMRWDPHVTPGYFDVMPNDGMAICACEKCKAYRDAGGKYNALIWKYTNGWAERLKKEGIKGYLTQMSYGNHEIPDGVKVPDNVLVMTALRGPWYYAPGYDLPEEKAHIADLITRSNGKVWYWCYTLKRGARMIEGVPHSTPRMLGKLYKTLMPYTFGIFLENGTDQYMFMFLHDYLTSEMFWDFSLDPDQVLDRAYVLMFGKNAAPFMDKFFRIQEDLWANHILSNRRMGPLGPEFDVADANKLWGELYSGKVISELDDLLKKAEAAAKSNPDDLARVKYIRQTFFDTVLDSRNRFMAEQQSVSSLNVAIPELSAPLNLDGKLDEAAWKKAAELPLKALKKDVIEVSTVVKLLRDKDYLYCAVIAEEPFMDRVRKDFTVDNHNMLWADTVMEFFFADAERTKYRQLIINTLGKKIGYNGHLDGNKYKIDGPWNSKAEVAGGTHAKGWQLEFRIPWSELYRDAEGALIANVGLSRHHKPKNPVVTYYVWSPFVKSYTDLLGFGRWVPGEVKSNNLLEPYGNFQVKQSGRFFGHWGTTAKAVKDGDAALDDKIFLFGGKSLRLKNTVPGTAVSVTIRPPMKPSTRYRLSWWVRTEDMGKNNLRGSVFPQIWNGDHNVQIAGKSVRNDIQWTRMSGEFVTAPAKEGKNFTPYISLYNYKSSGTAWFDGVELVEAGPAEK